MSTTAQHESEPVTAENLEAFLGQGNAAGLLFGAPWCAATALLQRQLGDLEPVAGVPLVNIDVDLFPHIADRYQVKSLPTFILLHAQREQARLLGAFSPVQVHSLLSRPLEAPRGKTRS